MESLVRAKFKEINLEDMLSQLGEDMTKNILSSFVCEKNPDVDSFLKEKAILFSQKNYAKTFLIFWEAEESQFGRSTKELVGYYAIAHKSITISRDMPSGNKMVSKKWRDICKVANTRSSEDSCVLSAHLIGQLGKNYNNGNNLLISGDDLLGMALKKVLEVIKLAGGKVVYVECEDEKKLLDFYNRNKFEVFGKRRLDRDETDLKGTYLMQLYRYL